MKQTLFSFAAVVAAFFSFVPAQAVALGASGSYHLNRLVVDKQPVLDNGKVISVSGDRSFWRDFLPVGGAVAPGDVPAYKFSLKSKNSGLVDVATGKNVTLKQESDLLVQGYLGDGKEVVLRVSMNNPEEAFVIVQQTSLFKSAKGHGDGISIPSGVIDLVRTVTDGDGDATSKSIDIGPTFFFLDSFMVVSGDGVFSANDVNNLVVASEYDDAVYGRAGDDSLRGEEGDDILYGGSGEDALYGIDGDDILYGGSDSDALYGLDGDDILYGGSGNDILYGGDGRNVLYGGSGFNVFVIGTNYDRIMDLGGLYESALNVYDLLLNSGVYPDDPGFDLNRYFTVKGDDSTTLTFHKDGDPGSGGRKIAKLNIHVSQKELADVLKVTDPRQGL